ncbi:MAG: sigma-54-dependent Fis family transcriptional regulator [Melioribacteraceae bacterium]|nr:sigma-54-dependent Fis family transcriptional regulator [Melioribacteraceae bacterium]
MPKYPIKIKIFSDIVEIESIIGAISKVETYKVKILLPNIDNFYFREDELIIIHPENIDSELIGYILKLEEIYHKQFVFIVDKNNALLASSLSKLNLKNIFVLPFEEQKFVDFIEDYITNLMSDMFHPNNIVNNTDEFQSICGTSSELQKAVNMAKTVAINTDINVLILGETGTGKGLFAKAIHNYGHDESSPFVEVTCTAIPEQLLESELFGYEKGAFTDARTRKPGLFELAEGGTIFLDEIGDLSLGLQSKLLRVIEKKVIRRLGGVTDIPVNTRIISATNKDLMEQVEKGLFRIDLYYRLNVITIDLAPLRGRKGDILPLAKKFIDEFSSQYKKEIMHIDGELVKFMNSYEWPGNVRELRNSVERAVLLLKGTTLYINHFENIVNKNPELIVSEHSILRESPEQILLNIDYTMNDLREISKLYARKVLSKLEGNKSKTAKILGISRPKLDTLIKTK